jgi:predicted RNase H-like nuclease (RuvC/YqgF family)
MAGDWSALDYSLFGSVAAASGALLTEVVRRVMPSRDRVLEDGAQIRSELRTTIAEMQSETRSLRGEVDAWQQRYYELQVQHSRLQGELEALRHELAELRMRLSA